VILGELKPCGFGDLPFADALDRFQVGFAPDDTGTASPCQP
jgi:hypothetical protein